MVGFVLERRVEVKGDGVTELDFNLEVRPEAIEEVVISGTRKMSKLASPVPVEVYSPAYSKPTRRRPVRRAGMRERRPTSDELLDLQNRGHPHSRA